jgi:hypothetical protein
VKKVLSLVLVGMMSFGLVACNKTNNAEKPKEETKTEEKTESKKFKIGLMTGTVAQGEEEYRAAEKMVREYGEDVIVFQTYPDNFMKEQETTITNAMNLAADPDVKAIIMVQAVPGASAAFEKVREKRPDILLIAGVPGEDPDMIAMKADIVLQGDELAMGYSVPAQAKKLGAKTFVHYSFPRHMSYPLLSQRRDIMKVECEKLGMTFVDATAPDPLGDAGVPGAQQFILEDVPRKIKEYGKDTNFFSTNCAMQEPLIKSTLENGGINAQQCCPSPFHGYPGALGIEIPTDKSGDVDFIVEQIKAKVAAQDGTGRFSTWPVPLNMLFVEVGVKYAMAYCEGQTTSKNDPDTLKRISSEVADGKEVKINTYKGTDKDGKEVNFDNFYMLLCDFIEF